MCSDVYFGTVTNQTGTTSDTGSLTDYHLFDSGSPTHSVGAGWPPEIPSSTIRSAPGIFAGDDLPDGFGWITYGSLLRRVVCYGIIMCLAVTPTMTNVL